MTSRYFDKSDHTEVFGAKTSHRYGSAGTRGVETGENWEWQLISTRWAPP